MSLLVFAYLSFPPFNEHISVLTILPWHCVSPELPTKGLLLPADGHWAARLSSAPNPGGTSEPPRKLQQAEPGLHPEQFNQASGGGARHQCLKAPQVIKV